MAISKSIDSLALRRLALRVAVAAAPLAALAACAAVLGIDDGHPRVGEDGGTEAGATTAEGGADAGTDANDLLVGDALADVVESDSSSGGGTLPDGAPIPTGCENVTADPATGVFVDGSGANAADVATCGSISAPCKSVNYGVSQAHNSATTPNVYVANGTYRESIDLGAGVNVYGGWIPGSTAWARECSQATTVIVAPPSSNMTVTVATGTAKLSTLTLESKGSADVQPGESIFGIVAIGASTSLTLVYVTVTTANGGNGFGGAEGDGGITPAGPCGDSSGDGGSGQTLGTKGPGADAGWFMATGYVATTGSPGGPGSPGENGGIGGPDTCVECVTGCGGSIGSCTITSSTKTCGATGQAGCGGGAGAGGAGGGGGGSSVALLAWDATINLTMTVLQAGGGGGAAAGGTGGPPGTGSPGANGTDSVTCNTGCVGIAGVVGCKQGSPDAAGLGGSPGGTGGNGTMGGTGGDGSGGDAFSYVEGGKATIIADSFTKSAYSNGQPGPIVDGGNGAPGRAGTQGP